MKELSDKEKAKLYDKAIEKAEKYHNGTLKDVIETIFPELAESEDERIRKGLIEACKQSLLVCGFHKDKVIAWLEKQGEKGINGNDEEIPNSDWSEEDKKMLAEIVKDLQVCKSKDISRATKDAYQNEIDWLKHLKERVQPQPKQEWSVEDRSKIQIICKYLNEVKKYCADITEVRECIEWLKALIPQNTWKPSDGQIKSLVLEQLKQL